jgi:hypothetical protein
MKKNNLIPSIIAIALLLLCTSCVNVILAKEIKGDGKMITKTINISDFSKVEIETYTEVNYSQGKNTGKLKITVDQNLWEYYDIFTKDDVLSIKLKKEHKEKVNLRPTKCLITISSEQLESIELAGSGKFNFCTAFKAPELNIDLAGSGKIFAHKYPVNIMECNIEIAGSGNVELTGNIAEGNIEIAGSGNVKALDCKFKQLNVEIAGSGNVEANVIDTLDVEIAGSGNVNFKGNPTVSTDIAGSGKVKKL